MGSVGSTWGIATESQAWEEALRPSASEAMKSEWLIQASQFSETLKSAFPCRVAPSTSRLRQSKVIVIIDKLHCDDHLTKNL
eukprot:6094769-Amphidinium_carterae.1